MMIIITQYPILLLLIGSWTRVITSKCSSRQRLRIKCRKNLTQTNLIITRMISLNTIIKSKTRLFKSNQPLKSYNMSRSSLKEFAGRNASLLTLIKRPWTPIGLPSQHLVNPSKKEGTIWKTLRLPMKRLVQTFRQLNFASVITSLKSAKTQTRLINDHDQIQQASLQAHLSAQFDYYAKSL